MPKNIAPTNEPVGIAQLREGMCRWPVNNPAVPDLMYCGEAVIGKGPYCRFHAAIAYHPARR